MIGNIVMVFGSQISFMSPLHNSRLEILSIYLIFQISILMPRTKNEDQNVCYYHS